MCWDISRQIDQAETLTFFSFNYVIDGHNPHSTEYCRKMSGIFPIFHYNLNIVAKLLSNIAKYSIPTLQFQLAEKIFKTNKH